MLVGDTDFDFAFGARLEAITTWQHCDVEDALLGGDDNLPDRGVDLCV